MQETIRFTAMARDVKEGLSAKPKYLNSKYFYDSRGSIIFRKIMQMPEYYLTDCEIEIFEQQKSLIYQAITGDEVPFDVVELGAGDGVKTKILLAHFLQLQPRMTYIPIDISKKAIQILDENLRNNLPTLNVQGQTGDYFKMMDELSRINKTRKVLLFLGSNIGNFTKEKSVSFLKQLKENMHPEDRLLIGFDLKKDPEVILRAYNDPHGYTASFNLNLLRRINEELGADFELMQFRHYESYDPQSGTALSFLISQKQQEVNIPALDLTFSFGKWEPIFMEMSQKYDLSMIRSLAEAAGFQIIKNFTDSREYFMNSLWRSKNRD